MVPEPQLGACRQNLAISLAQWSGVVGLCDGIGTGGVIAADALGYFIESPAVTLKGGSHSGKILPALDGNIDVSWI